MYLPGELLLLLLIGFDTTHGAPSPSRGHDIEERQADVDCDNQGTVFAPECWIRLGLSAYLNDPETGWNVTTPICTDSSRCCLEDEPWSKCFLRLGRGLGGGDCSTMDDQMCTWDNTVSASLDPSIRSKVRYVIKSIYGVHDFFSSYFKALQYATTQTSLMIGPLTSAIDPDSDTMLGLNVLMFMLSFGLAFLTAPTVAAGLLLASWATQLKHSAQTFAISLQQAPAIARTIWPTGGVASRMVQMSELDSRLSNATDELAEILDRGLKFLMSDMPTFVNFAQSGEYCGDDSIDIAAKTNELDLALRTYITSESMKQNGWYAVPLRNSTEEEYKALVEAAPTARGWRAGPGVVNKIWWSPFTGRQYSLEHKGPETVKAEDLINNILNGGWAHLPTIFDGSYDCTAWGRSGSADLIRVHFNGTFDTSCISQLPIYVPCNSNCPQKLDDGSCPFGFKEDCNNPWSLPGLPPDRQQPGFVNPPP